MRGVTSVPLPAYWSSKDPEQWRRCPLKTLACTNPRCAANNANYGTNISEPPAKRPRRPYRTSSGSRSVSATSIPSTPVEPERTTKSRYVTRCSDCNAPLVPLAQRTSSGTTLTPPTPLQVRTVARGSYGQGSHCISSYVPIRTRVPPPYFHERSNKKKPNSRAPPPSECDDYSSEEPAPCFRGGIRLSNEVGEEYGKDPAPKFSGSFDQTSTGATVTEPGSPTSLPPNSESNIHEGEDVLLSFMSISVNETTIEIEAKESENRNPIQDDINLLSLLKGSHHVGSESSASPAPSEKGLNFFNDIPPVCDRNCISSFYNVLYTPDANTDEQQVDLDVGRGGTEHDLNLKLALEIAVLSAFVTIVLLACFPSFLSGVRYYVLGCCSCICQTAASAATTIPSPHCGQLKWLERWVHRGAHSLLGCRSPRQVVGSTVLR